MLGYWLAPGSNRPRTERDGFEAAYPLDGWLAGFVCFVFMGLGVHPI